MSKRDYYDVLGLAKNASEDDIKLAYRKMASKYHPDKVTGDTEKASVEVKFKEAKEAYETLSDHDKRSVYDAYGHNTDSFTHTKHQTHKSWNFNNREDIDNIFSELFRNHSEFSNRANTQNTTINISLKDAYTGRVVRHDNTEIVIPKGVRSGTRLYVSGKFYKIEVIQHEKFKRALDDLMTEMTLTAIEAMIGAEAVLEHLDGNKLQFSIPAGIQNGQIIKLAKTGMKNPEMEYIGDMLVRVNITIPKNLSENDKILLKNLPRRESIII